jgi:Spy/CpxP family protein refolding chaperone
MTRVKTLAITAALLLGASSFALAQTTNGNPTYNAAHSGGPGTHVDSQKTGSKSNDEKVLHNRNGYSGGRQ